VETHLHFEVHPHLSADAKKNRTMNRNMLQSGSADCWTNIFFANQFNFIEKAIIVKFLKTYFCKSIPRFTITGLVPGATYSFQIAVAGSKGQAVYTDIITKMVV
jgi:hypothetical protein